jgi:hypothetical protein
MPRKQPREPKGAPDKNRDGKGDGGQFTGDPTSGILKLKSGESLETAGLRIERRSTSYAVHYPNGNERTFPVGRGSTRAVRAAEVSQAVTAYKHTPRATPSGQGVKVGTGAGGPEIMRIWAQKLTDGALADRLAQAARPRHGMTEDQRTAILDEAKKRWGPKGENYPKPTTRRLPPAANKLPKLAREKGHQPAIAKVDKAHSHSLAMSVEDLSDEELGELYAKGDASKKRIAFDEMQRRLERDEGPGALTGPPVVPEEYQKAAPMLKAANRQKRARRSSEPPSRGTLPREGRLPESERLYDGHGASRYRAAPAFVADLDAWERAAEKVNEGRAAKGLSPRYDDWDGKSDFGKAVNLYKAYIKRTDPDQRRPKVDRRNA